MKNPKEPAKCDEFSAAVDKAFASRVCILVSLRYFASTHSCLVYRARSCCRHWSFRKRKSTASIVKTIKRKNCHLQTLPPTSHFSYHAQRRMTFQILSAAASYEAPSSSWAQTQTEIINFRNQRCSTFSIHVITSGWRNVTQFINRAVILRWRTALVEFCLCSSISPVKMSWSFGQQARDASRDEQNIQAVRLNISLYVHPRRIIPVIKP